jgi:hypothetical protein
MKLAINKWLSGGSKWLGLCLIVLRQIVLCQIVLCQIVLCQIVLYLMGPALSSVAHGQAVSTTTVQGTVYLANGQAASGTLAISWPAFTTASGLTVAADSMTVTIGSDGFVSVNLAPNSGATPAGLYYTAVYYLSDGTTSTEYWVVPSAAQATLAQVQAQVMPAAQAVQAVSKAYVDQAITEALGSLLTASGGTLTGPLYLSGDPTQPLQAADKHYVDTTFNLEVPITGGFMTGPFWAPEINGVESPVAGTSQTTLEAAMTAAGTTGAMEIPPTYAGTDTFTNPNGVFVTDLRPTGAQQLARSVKEFGAVCDGATDDTNALQTALNYAGTHGVALTIPQGTCKTRSLNWSGQSIGGLGKQQSALLGFPGQDVLATVADSTNLLSYTRIHDLTIYVDQSVDVSCSAAEGRAAAGSCAVSRLMEPNSIFSSGGSGLTGSTGTGAGWAVGNCAIAMPAATGAGGNGLRVAEIENVEIAATGVDPMAQYTGAHSTHTCGLYLGQWPQWSDFRNIDIRGLNTGIAIPALPVTTPAGLNADSNRWQNITIQATHGFTAAAGSNNVLDNIAAAVGNSAATAEPPTGLVLHLPGTQQGWTVRNAVVSPAWNAVPPKLTVTASGGAVTAVTVGPEYGLGLDPYGTQIPLTFSGSCTAAATANVNSNGAIGTVTVTAGGVGCSATTTASLNAAGTWDTAAPVNLIAGQNMAFFGGNLLKGNGGYTVWNAAGSQSYGTQLDGGGGTLPGGGTYAALVANNPVGSAYPVDQFPGADFGAKLQACLGTLSASYGGASYGGTCDARNFTGTLSMGSNLTISTANATVLLPCATVSTAKQVIVSAGVRNTYIHGCAYQGGSTSSGTQGGTVWVYSGSGAAFLIGDTTYAANTPGFHLDNINLNTASAGASAMGFAFYRTEEIDLRNVYLNGNQSTGQTGIYLDGTGNYTGGTFDSNTINGFGAGLYLTGHLAGSTVVGDFTNASTFLRQHIVCPASGGYPVAGTYGVNAIAADGDTWTGGDVEGCATMFHLGANAVNNTVVGLRNENSTIQYQADSGSSDNYVATGGTIFTGDLIDNGSRNSFWDAFHRTVNGMKGDLYASQQDVTITDHQRLGIGLGNERGRSTEYQTDYGYRWQAGLSDGTTGMQTWFVNDMLNNLNRIEVDQYLSATADVVTNVMLNNSGCYSSSTPPTLAFSGGGGSGAAGTANMYASSSSSSCSGGWSVGSVTMTAVGTGYTSQPTVTWSGSNQITAPNAVAEIATVGSTNNQTVINSAGTGAVVLNGSANAGTGGVVIGSGGASSSQVANFDSSGNLSTLGNHLFYSGSTLAWEWECAYLTGCSLHNANATTPMNPFIAYTNGGTEIDSQGTSAVVINNHSAGGTGGFIVYGGGAAYNTLLFQVSPNGTGTPLLQFPGLAGTGSASCLYTDASGYFHGTGSACGTGSSSVTGTINSGTSGQIATYTAGGTTLSGINSVPVTAGGTGAVSGPAALANLGAEPVSLTGTGAPSSSCSSSINNGTFYTSAALSLYQCSSATGAYQWNLVSGSAGVSSINSLSGSLNVIAGAGISVTPSGSSITIGNTGNGAPAVYYNVLNHGAKADEVSSGNDTGNLTSGSTTFYVPAWNFTSADVGKYVSIYYETTVPFATGTNTPGNVAQIVSVTDSQHVVLSKAATATESSTFFYGTDNTVPFNACATAVYAAGGGTCAIPAGNYLLATNGVDAYGNEVVLANGAQDDGGYGSTNAGGSGASLTFTVSNGKITGYTITSGGSNYPDNVALWVSFSGGCPAVYVGPCGGEVAYANTNSSGVVSSVTVSYPGYGLSSALTGTVSVQGGDGAAATCALSSGTCGTPTVASSGSGYTLSGSGPAIHAVNASGGTCTQIGGNANGLPSLVGLGTSTTNSSGKVTSATWTTAPSGCGTTAPLIRFGDSLCWDATTSAFDAQCTIVAPLVPAAIPVQVPTLLGVSWFGTSGASQAGTNLIGNWDDVTVDTPSAGTTLTQPAMFGGQIQQFDMGGMSLASTFVGIFANNNANRANIHDMTFSGGIGLFTASTDLGFQTNNLWLGGYAGWVNGGQWGHRSDFGLGEGGYLDGLGSTNIVSEPGGYNSTAAAIDNWFGEFYWRPEFSGNSGDFDETCAFPQTTNQRQTSHSISTAQGANSMCYKGITGFGLVNLMRDNRGAGGGSISQLIGKYLYRPIFYGSWGSGTFSQASCEGCNQITSDPYRAESIQEGAVEFTGGTDAYFDGVGWSGSEIAQPLYNIGSPFSVSGSPLGVSAWQDLSASSQVNSQAAQNLNVQSVIENGYGEEISYGLGTGQQAKLIFDNSSGSGTKITAGGFEGDGENANSFSAWGTNFTNKLMTFNTDQVNMLAPFYDTAIAPASGTNCVQVSSTGLLSNTGAACSFGAAGGDLSGSYPSPTVAKIAGGAIPTSVNHAGYNSSGQPVASPNTLGCTDGYDHLPCVVYTQSTVSESSPTAAYATNYTTPAAGLYRVTGYFYGTTVSSTAYQAGAYAQATEVGQSAAHAVLIQSYQIGTSISANNGYAAVFNVASGTAIQSGSFTVSGSNTGGAWSRGLVIERLQ